MKELTDIFAEADRLKKEGQPFALATVAKIDGSAYRQPGAQMLVTPEGATFGTISGGCLEQEVAQQALNLMDEGSGPRMEAFDLSDDDLIVGYGIGCEGQVHVLMEPLPAKDRPDPLDLLTFGLDHRIPGVMITVIDAPETPDLVGYRMLRLDDGTVHGAADTPGMEAALDDALHKLDDGEDTHVATYDTEAGPVEVLIERVEPPIHLVVFGGGHDVRPVTRVARELGWPTTVVGSKAPGELRAKFPEATKHVFLMNPEDVRDQVKLDARSPVVIMNHNFERDKTLVGELMHTEVPYAGALGPRYRTERMMRELRDASDTPLPDDHFERLHGPVGLDIGTETPQEIALSIVAEIQAEMHGRSASKLRERGAPIHA